MNVLDRWAQARQRSLDDRRRNEAFEAAKERESLGRLLAERGVDEPVAGAFRVSATDPNIRLIAVVVGAYASTLGVVGLVAVAAVVVWWLLRRPEVGAFRVAVSESHVAVLTKDGRSVHDVVGLDDVSFVDRPLIGGAIDVGTRRLYASGVERDRAVRLLGAGRPTT